MRDVLFNNRLTPCGVLRKQPILFVQDSNYVQVVWETNCKTAEKDMMLLYWTEMKKKTVLGPIKPQVLDATHTVYKATIGPLLNNDPVHYSIQIFGDNRLYRTRILAEHSFNWHIKRDDRSIRVAALADNQFGMLTFMSLLQKIENMEPDYFIHAGDAVQNYPSLRQWQTDFFSPLSVFGFGQSKPIIYAHGNHDFDPSLIYTYTRSSKHPWFSFTLADDAIYFIILDSNLDWEIQDKWLKAETMTDAFQNAKFRIVIVHVPPFLEYWDPKAWFQLRQSEWSSFVRDRFVPIFEQSGIDLVISGHQHNYERGERNGIKYAIIGGAGGDLDFEQVKDWGIYEAKSFNFHFVILEFKPPMSENQAWKMQWDTYNLNGKRIDSTAIESVSKR